MSLKLSAFLICLCFSSFETKILMSASELENNIENNSVESNDKGRINLSMPGKN